MMIIITLLTCRCRMFGVREEMQVLWVTVDEYYKSHNIQIRKGAEMGLDKMQSLIEIH